MNAEAIIRLFGYEITGTEHSGGGVRIQARWAGTISCPECSSEKLRNKGRYQRIVRHESWGMRVAG